MPGAIAQAGFCHAVLPLPRIAPNLSRSCEWSTHEPAAFYRRLRVFARLKPSRAGDRPRQLYLLETRLAPILKAEGLRDLDALADRLRRPGTETLAARRSSRR